MGAADEIAGVLPVIVVSGLAMKMSDAAFQNAKSHYAPRKRRKVRKSRRSKR